MGAARRCGVNRLPHPSHGRCARSALRLRAWGRPVGRPACLHEAEGEAGEPAATVAAVVADANAAIDRALEQLRATSPEALKDDRKVGRAGLPSTVLGLLMHGAEHSTRHAGQAITTSIILRGAK